MGLTTSIRRLAGLPRRAAALLLRGDATLQATEAAARRSAKLAAEAVKKQDTLRADVRKIDRSLRDEMQAVRKELRERLLQYNQQLSRLAGAGMGAASPDGAPQRLSRRTVPVDGVEAAEAEWDAIGGGVDAPDPDGREWLELAECPVCGGSTFTRVSPWNKLILLAKAPDPTSAVYDYSLCHACGVLFAAHRPVGARFHFLLEHFGEVTAKRGGTAEISNRVLNPYPLNEADRQELRRRAAPGVYVSDHLGLPAKEYLGSLLSDRFENSLHVDILGTLLEPRGARVLEVRSRAATILDGLRRAWGAEVYAMPIWESQQFLLREVFRIETSDLIDFEHFAIPFPGPFDVIVCNHMFTHALRPRDFFATLRAKLKPGGHVYLYNEPDDVEFLAGNQSMLATLNPLHMQAFDQPSLVRALAVNGFETVFVKRRNLAHLVLARAAGRPLAFTPMNDRERQTRLEAYQRAFDRAVLAMEPPVRSRAAAEWPAIVERAVAMGTAEFDDEGQLRIVAR